VTTDPETPADVGKVWQSWFATSAFDVDKRLRRIFRILPSDPRCKFCNAPFHGAGGLIVRVLLRKQASAMNPRFCNMCDEAMRKFPGGAEVEMSMLFADIRGSTELSAQMSPAEFGGLINRFYSAATQCISAEDGLLEKLAGDAVAAFWGAGFAGPDYVQRTLKVARQMSSRMQKHGIPVGIGVHTGVAFFGAVGTPDGLINMTAAGEQVNLAARLASQAAAGEVVVSEQAIQAAGVNGTGLESRSLQLKGIEAPVAVRVLRSA
jgi:adenylate cyclase